MTVEGGYMTGPRTVKSVHAALRRYGRNCPDIGLGKALADAALDPANPFGQEVARRPQRWFVLFCLLVVVAFGFFIFFNNLW
jgi:hypothetical protein